MRHADHVALLRAAVPPGLIHSVDRDGSALRVQRELLRDRFPTVSLQVHRADLTHALDVPPLDGIVMANTLHFHRDHLAVVRHVGRYVRPRGRFVLIEYDADRGNEWVPHPLSFRTWERVAAEAGLLDTKLLHRVPSRFLGAIYSALSFTS